MSERRNALKRTWVAFKSRLCSTPRDTARSSEASPQAAQSQSHITPSVPIIDQLAHSTEGGSDSSRQAEAVPVPEQGLASFTKQSYRLSYELWNKAYDELEKDESELVGNYAKVLAKALAEEITEARYEETRDDSVGHSDERKYVKDLTARVFVELNVSKAKTTVDEAPPGSRSAELDQISTSILAKLKDPAKRQMLLEMLVSRGQLKVKKTEGIAKAAGYVAEKGLFIKPAVDLILQIPQAAPAALPWAGICLGMKMLSYPADSAQEQRDGFSFVAHRMQWYYAMTDYLLDHDNKSSTGQDSASILEMLTEKLFDLYKAILRYQLLSVCYYYSNPFRQLYDNVDWAGSKKAVEDAECVFSKDWDCYKKVEARNLWENIGQTLQNYVSQQNARLLTHENREYLQALWVGDPQDEMNDIENKKGGLYDNMCEWMLSHPNYRAFTAWDENRSCLGGRLLWIKGPAGIGKTMVMIRIVRNLLKQRRVQNLAYFFCQSAKSNQNTATTIVRALLWMLLIQQPNLITHMQTKFQWAGKDMFEKDSTIRGLLEVFENISKDASPVYFFVDALDECDEGQKEIIELIAASLKVSNNVRWLITSRTEVELVGKVTLATMNASVVLDEIDVLAQTGRDEMYIQHRLSALKEQPGLEYDRVDCEKLKKEMQERADGNLLWLAVVFDSIEEMRAEYAQNEIKNAPRGVKELYDHKIRQIQRREAKVLCKDLGSISDIAFSYDGKQLAAVWEKGNVRLWNLLTGEEANMHTFHSKTVRALEFSRDGTLASASDDRTVRIWDPAKSNTMKILRGHTDWIFAIAFSHDGKQLASASRDDTVRLWDAATGSELRLFGDFDFETVKSNLAFMADGKDLLLCSWGCITRLNVATGAKTLLLNSQTRHDFVEFALSPDCTQLATRNKSLTIELWDLKTGDALQGLRTVSGTRL
ncbi:hypothetical protein ACQRIU_007062 [Beauveria bassiana]